MSELKKIASTLNRICKSVRDCIECPLESYDDICGIAVLSSEDCEKIERAVDDWASKHPEPTYPTWGEWFLKTHQVPTIHGCDNDWFALINSRIPTEFAEKLGIEPVDKHA